MARDETVRTRSATTDEPPLPNTVTIVGRGVPANYEVTVDGNLEMLDAEPFAEGTVVSGNAAEGSIDAGVHRFRFSGELANVHVVDWNGNAVPESKSIPTINVEYGIADR